MGAYIETIAQFKPKNGSNFAIADVNDLKGGYILVETNSDMRAYLNKYSNRLKNGMLCYVIDENKIYLYLDSNWKEWKVLLEHLENNDSGIKIVEYLDEAEEVEGSLVYAKDYKALFYYSNKWNSLSKIYILNTEPLDKAGIWIDTSEDNSLNTTTAQSLLKMINILSRKVSLLEYLNQQITSGNFNNNMYDIYGNIVGVDPEDEIYGTVDLEEALQSSQTLDNNEEELLSNTLLSDSQEPVEYKDLLPNVKHIQIKWGKKEDMLKFLQNFMPAELLWCYDTRQLWIKDPKTYQLIQVGTASSNNPEITDNDIMNGIIQDTTNNYIEGITFVDMLDSSKHYTFSVLNGAIDLYDSSLDTHNPNPITIATRIDSADDIEYFSYPYIPTLLVYHVQGKSPVPNSMIGINAVYGGNYNAYNPCDYTFVEIANQTPEDINLHGMYLHYTEDGSRWVSLPLRGILKAYSTFLIRGAAVGDSKFAAMHIESADQYWTKDMSYNVNCLANISETFPNNFIRFAENCSLLLTGPITSKSEDGIDTVKASLEILKTGFTCSTPWAEGRLVCGFMDLVGFGKNGDNNMPCISASLNKINGNNLYFKYYNLDPVSLAYKSILKADSSNTSMWNTVNLTDIDQCTDLNCWVLKKGGHDIFFDKSKIESGAPLIITCTFGFDAHKTRCFTWVSKGYRNEFIKYRLKGTTEWTTVESFRQGDRREAVNNRENSIYNRIQAVSSDGTYFTVHKVILDFNMPEPGNTAVYEYIVGYDRNYSDIRTFTLRNKQDVIRNGFSFVLVTDQQGFNFMEYETWRLAAEYINQESKKDNTEESNVHFVINTGDATLNGNRMNEWIDYFVAGDSLFNHLEQMYEVGNNDLCSIDPKAFGNGDDTTKNNPINVEYFFTFEHPSGIPVSTNGKYIPCVYSFVYGNTYFLGCNSEITDSSSSVQAALTLWGLDTKSLYNDVIKEWAENDLNSLEEKPYWKIAYCHENPFTLLIKDVVSTYNKEIVDNNITKEDLPNYVYKTRGDVTSHFNSPGEWWFSKFLEDNEFNLSICGHKHTFTNSYYLHDNPINRMCPYIYDEGQELVTTSGLLGILSSDVDNMNFVKYVMCQATGYKLVSNKELPANDITWLKEYYPSNSNKSDARVNALKFPCYIIWNIGIGNETEDSTKEISRNRILGKAKKLVRTSNTKAAIYKSAGARFGLDDVSAVGGNGPTHSDHNIIVEKLKLDEHDKAF